MPVEVLGAASSWRDFKESGPATQWIYSIVMGAWFLGMLYVTVRSYNRRMAKKLKANSFYTTADEVSVERKRAYGEMKLRLRIAKLMIELFCTGLFALAMLAMCWAVLTDPAKTFFDALQENWWLPPIPLLAAVAFKFFYRDLKRMRVELKALAQE